MDALGEFSLVTKAKGFVNKFSKVPQNLYKSILTKPVICVNLVPVMVNNDKTTHIRIDLDLKKFLDKQIIRKGESYNEIIRRLLEDKWKVKIPAENEAKKEGV